MATKKQIEANRRNAKKSCGPKSEETKAAVSKNSVKHGLCGDFCVLGFESQKEFDELLAQFRRDEKPTDSVEEELVLKMARHTWMSNRAIRLQQACFIVEDPDTPQQKAAGAKGVSVRIDLDLHIRYQVQNDRAYQRASKELRDYRKERRLAEIGFAREKRAQAEELRKEAAEMRKQNNEMRKQADENRKAEKHQVALATSNLKKQRAEMEFGKQLANTLPPNFDLSSLNSLLSGAASFATAPTRETR